MAGAAMLQAACGGSSAASAPAKPSGRASQSATSAGSSAIKISNFAFTPATVTAQRGAGVTVSNDDGTAHTATADDGHSFDTGTLDPGASQTVVPTKPGTYAYHCSIHPFMHGKIVVR